MFQRVPYSGSRSSIHVGKIADTKGGTVSHKPVSCKHNPLIIGWGKDDFFIRKIENYFMLFPVFFCPPFCLIRAGNSGGKNHIRIPVPQPYRLKCRQRVKSKCASTVKSSVSGRICMHQESINILPDVLFHIRRNLSVTGKKRSPRNTVRIEVFSEHDNQSILRTARNASLGICTVPNCLILFFPSFCFSRSFFLRVISPP